MSRQGKMNVVFISIALAAFAGALVAMVAMKPAIPASPVDVSAPGAAPGPRRPIVYAVPIFLVVVIALVMRRSLAQQRWLLAEGGVVMARVTKQWVARNGHGIRYEFVTRSGDTFSLVTTDSTRRLLVGMMMPVFRSRTSQESSRAMRGFLRSGATWRKLMRLCRESAHQLSNL